MILRLNMSDWFIYLIIAITSLFAFFAVFYVVRLSWKLRAEKDDFQLLQEKLQKMKSHGEDAAKVYLEILSPLSGETDVFKMTESIISAKKNEIKIKESLLEELINSFRTGDIHFIRKITGFLILIGLIGTLAGLSFGLKDIDIANIYDATEINTFLGHISNALLSSMVAVLSTVILIIITHFFYEKQRDKLENEVSLFFRLQLIPYLYPEEIKTDNLSQIQTILSTFAISATQMLTISSQNMKEFQKSTADLLDAILLNNAQINRLQSSIKDVYEPFTEITKVQQQIAAISVSISESVKESQNISKDSRGLITELKNASTDIIQSVKQTDNKIDQQTNDVSKLILEMAKVVSELKFIAGSYNDLLPHFGLINDNTSQYLNQMNGNFTQIISNIEAKFISTISSIENTSEKQITQPMQGFVEKVLPALTELIGDFTKVLTEIKNLKELSEKQDHSIHRDFEGVILKISALMDTLPKQNQVSSQNISKKNKGKQISQHPNQINKKPEYRESIEIDPQGQSNQEEPENKDKTEAGIDSNKDEQIEMSSKNNDSLTPLVEGDKESVEDVTDSPLSKEQTQQPESDESTSPKEVIIVPENNGVLPPKPRWIERIKGLITLKSLKDRKFRK